MNISSLCLDKIRYIDDSLSFLKIKDSYILYRLICNEKNINIFKEVLKSICKQIWNVINNEIPHTVNEESTAATVICWIGLIIWKHILYNHGFMKSVKMGRREELVLLLYIGSDYILDSPDVSIEEKIEMSKLIKRRLGGEIVKSNYNSVNIILNIIDETLKLSPNSLNGLKEAWKAETSKTSSPLLDCMYKGWKTIYMASCIINDGKDMPGSLELGSASQLVDDLMDWEIDMEDEIDTDCTECIKNGKYDEYIYKCFVCVNELPMIYVPIKVLFLHCISSCGYNNPYISEELKSILGRILIVKNKLNINKFINDIIK